jgi:hypothetical protein
MIIINIVMKISESKPAPAPPCNGGPASCGTDAELYFILIKVTFPLEVT